MPLIKWNDDFSVGVIEIDLQHKGLVHQINKLYDAMLRGEANSILRGIISELVRYTQVHFATEEKYFKKFGYAESEDHIQEHQEFIEVVGKFKEEYEKGSLVLSIDVLKFLKNWLTHHILGSDKKFTQCFNDNGLF